MLKTFTILDVKNPDEQFENRSECYLTLSDKNDKSDNRYYVRLILDNAVVDWHVGDCLTVEISLCAYRNNGLWHMSKYSDLIELIEINNLSNNFKL